MRTRNLIACLFLAVLVGGCSGERRRVSRETNALTATYVIKMDAGQTTNEQDKRFIRAISKVAYELDRHIRGEKKAKKTRESSEALSSAGAGTELDLD